MLKHEELNWFEDTNEFIVLISDTREYLIENVINWLKDKQFLTKSDIYHSRKSSELHIRYPAWEKLTLSDRSYIRAFTSVYALGYRDGYDAAIYIE